MIVKTSILHTVAYIGCIPAISLLSLSPSAEGSKFKDTKLTALKKHSFFFMHRNKHS